VAREALINVERVEHVSTDRLAREWEAHDRLRGLFDDLSW
jgi:hypothetical protein